jgi:hypothetical protein
MEHTPTPSPSVVFTFGLTVESINEFGGASFGMRFERPNFVQIRCFFNCSKSVKIYNTLMKLH